MDKEKKKDEISDGITILSKGIDGNTNYSVLNTKTGIVIVSFLGLEKFSKRIIETYPELARTIHDLSEKGVTIDLPKNVEMPKEPTARGRLLEKISDDFLKYKK